MAIVRCAQCGVTGPHFKIEYPHQVRPYGGDVSALVCGKEPCRNAGLIWLESDEWAAYKAGERVFGLRRNRAKVRAADPN